MFGRVVVWVLPHARLPEGMVAAYETCPRACAQRCHNRKYCFGGNLLFEFEFLLIESILTNLLLRGHNIRLRCGSKAGPDVRAFRERTGHRSVCLQS